MEETVDCKLFSGITISHNPDHTNTAPSSINITGKLKGYKPTKRYIAMSGVGLLESDDYNAPLDEWTKCEEVDNA